MIGIDTSGGTAVYEVTFDRDVSDCGWSATVANTVAAAPFPGGIAVRAAADPNAVVVHTTNPDGTPTVNRFFLVVNC